MIYIAAAGSGEEVLSKEYMIHSLEICSQAGGGGGGGLLA